jgi:Transglutaminase-like superfamily
MNVTSPGFISERGRERRRDIQGHLRDFLLSGSPLRPEVWVGTRELVPALIPAVRMGRLFESRGLSAALAAMPPVSSHRPARGAADTQTIFSARSAGWRLQGLLRTVTGSHRCLHESLAICAGLRRLGFPAQVVIGYPVLELPDGRDELHAWPVLGPTPLVGRPDSSRTNYLELSRYPTATDRSAG